MKSVKSMSLHSGPSTWLTRRIVSAVRCARSAWHPERKGIELVAPAQFVVFCHPLSRWLLNASRFYSDQSAGSM